MTFKETKGNKTVEAKVMPAPGGMFKGVIRVTIQRNDQTFGYTTGRGCGRPMRSEPAALELAELEARRLLGM
jgi:hypothetical protein